MSDEAHHRVCRAHASRFSTTTSISKVLQVICKDRNFSKIPTTAALYETIQYIVL